MINCLAGPGNLQSYKTAISVSPGEIQLAIIPIIKKYILLLQVQGTGLTQKLYSDTGFMSTSITKEPVLLLVLIVTLLSTSGCALKAEGGRCERLMDVASRPEVQDMLTSWVDENLETLINNGQYKPSSGVKPGEFRIIEPNFDWSLLGFDDRRAGVRFGSRAAGVAENPFYVSFAEVSRFSILVGVKGHQLFPEDDVRYEKRISERVGVYCASE